MPEFPTDIRGSGGAGDQNLDNPLDGHKVERVARIDGVSTIGLPAFDHTREFMTLDLALCHFLLAAKWPADLPPTDEERVNSPENIPMMKSETYKPVPLELYKNLFWGLTEDVVFQDAERQGTLIGFITENDFLELRGRAGSNSDVALVKVLVESSPLVTAMNAAMRLWSFFAQNKPGFTVLTGSVDATTGARLAVRQPDFAVQEAKPIGAPRVEGIVGDNRAQVTFRLQVKLSRFL